MTVFSFTLFVYSHTAGVVAILLCVDDSAALIVVCDNLKLSVVVEFSEGNSESSVEHNL